MIGAEAVVLALGGTWYGHFGMALCPAHDNTRTPALSLADARDGRLLAKCHAGCAFGDVAAALRNLGIETGGQLQIDPAKTARRDAEAEAHESKRRAQAAQCWTEAKPAAGTLAARYLRARGFRGPVPETLRFDTACWHSGTAQRLPAMVALIKQADEALAVHRTYVAEPGRKADVSPNKAMLGPVKGGAVRLSSGVEPLLVAEGIETSLALLQFHAGIAPSVWAGLSASGVAGLILPQHSGELVIAPDGDGVGRTAAEKLASRAWSLDWAVRIMEPPGDGLDWADAAQTIAGIATLAGEHAA